MDQILLCSSQIPPVTSIHNSFIKNDMLDANGSYVKVYLYLSMCIQSGDTSLSISSLADRMENTEKDILRALLYWEKKKLLSLSRNSTGQIIGLELLPPRTDALSTENPAVALQPEYTPMPEFTPVPEIQNKPADVIDLKERTAVPEKTASRFKSEKREHSVSITEEQLLQLSSDGTFTWTTNIVESFLERPLNPGEIRLLMYLYDNLSFSKELILYLYEYCCSIGKTNLQYVQAVAFSWADEGIKTPQEAQERTANYNSLYTAVAKAFGLNRILGSIEIQYVKRWHSEWELDAAVIIEACNRTILSIQKADFKYTDSILRNWNEQGVHTLQDVHMCDDNYAKSKATEKAGPHRPKTAGSKNQFQSFEQRDVSEAELKDLERLLLSQ